MINNSLKESPVHLSFAGDLSAQDWDDRGWKEQLVRRYKQGKIYYMYHGRILRHAWIADTEGLFCLLQAMNP